MAQTYGSWQSFAEDFVAGRQLWIDSVGREWTGHDEWIALPRRHLPEGDMGGICRKLCFGSSALPNAPKCSRQLIPSSTARDTTWRMRVPGRVALASVSSRAGHRRPFAQRLLGS
ncbi:hypothetical protein ACH4Q6_33135 [Streptomyces lydicus]|uniref:hypothetical protein n=1 Tax=Streptomyces lydicus TaxID=47763 RepID=UPI0037A47C38